MLGTTNPGGNWNASDFDLIYLMGDLAGTYNNMIVIESYVSTDQKNSSRHVLKVSISNAYRFLFVHLF